MKKALLLISLLVAAAIAQAGAVIDSNGAPVKDSNGNAVTSGV